MPFFIHPQGKSREENATTTTEKIGVLLVNLGTPDAPTPAAVRRYLKAFLSDRRVIDLPRALWLPILYGAILPCRPRQSAKKYQKIWTKEGSPLLTHTQNQCAALREMLNAQAAELNLREKQVFVECAMRYGNPSIPSALDKLLRENLGQIIVLPLYPQYSSGTTGSVFDAVARYFLRVRAAPSLQLIRNFYKHPSYLEALRVRVLTSWQERGRPEHLLISFHGSPIKSIADGDPYYSECVQTAENLATSLNLPRDFWTLSFQSRFGRERWITPYTTDVLGELAAQGCKRVDVLCPSFVSDCLETLEEIGITEHEKFTRAGGGQLYMIPALNTMPEFIVALRDILRIDQ